MDRSPPAGRPAVPAALGAHRRRGAPRWDWHPRAGCSRSDRGGQGVCTAGQAERRDEPAADGAWHSREQLSTSSGGRATGTASAAGSSPRSWLGPRRPPPRRPVRAHPIDASAFPGLPDPAPDPTWQAAAWLSRRTSGLVSLSRDRANAWANWPLTQACPRLTGPSRAGDAVDRVLA